jgi:hypothetical protein
LLLTRHPLCPRSRERRKEIRQILLEARRNSDGMPMPPESLEDMDQESPSRNY